MYNKNDLVNKFEHFSQDTDAMGNPVSLYEISEMQKNMEPTEFYEGLKISVIDAFKKQKLPIIYSILEIDPSVAEEAEVKTVAVEYFNSMTSKGWEPDQELKNIFKL